jgi:hypothetical protein
MISKILSVSAVVGGILLAQSPIANAGVNVDVVVSPYSSPYPIQYDPDYSSSSYHRDYDDDYDDDYDRISCWEGRRIVRRAGYRGVQTIKCYGDIYRFRGWRRGHQWRVSVDADTGRIVRARPMDYY